MSNNETWQRTIKTRSFAITSLDIVDNSAQAAYEAALGKLPSAMLLAHVLDGVIWATVENQQIMQQSNTVLDISPQFNVDNLLQVRLFTAQKEVSIWKRGDQWFGRVITDDTGTAGRTFDEQHLLWGTETHIQNGFTILDDGSQGLKHAVVGTYSLPPSDNRNPLKQRLTMQVRHYLQQRENGMSYIADSRICKIGVYDFKSAQYVNSEEVRS